MMGTFHDVNFLMEVIFILGEGGISCIVEELS